MRAPMTKVAVALLVLAACNGNNYNPIAPPTASPPPAPTERSTTANYSLGVYTNSGAGVEEVQVFLDGVVVCVGRLASYWDYDGVCNSGDLGSLTVGRHTFSFKVTRQGVSPTRYQVSAHVSVVFKENGRIVNSQPVASWKEEVTLATDDTWAREFVMADPSGPRSTSVLQEGLAP